MALASTAGDFRSTLMSRGGYKPGQGTWARGLTFAAIATLTVYGCWEWYWSHLTDRVWVQMGIPAALAAATVWCAWRLIHFPKFADFLISTEAEMNKVSWPSWKDVKTATIVVLALALLLAAFLYGVDILWQKFLMLIKVLQYTTRVIGDGAQ